MIEFDFINKNNNVIVKSWENWLGIGPYSGILNTYDEKVAQGILFFLEIEKGLNVVVGDNTYKDDVMFTNKTYKEENNFTLTLDYLALGGVQVIENMKTPKEKKHPMLNMSVLHHGKSNFSFFVPKGIRTRVIDLIISHEWFFNQFAPSQHPTIKENMLKIEQNRHFYIDPVSVKSFELIREIIDKVFYGEWDYIFLRPRILFLIGEFVNTYIFPTKDAQEKTISNGQLLNMEEVKQKINTAIYEKLPNKKVLAREFAMSESTLDRHFRKAFGKTIYEYHLEEKMELAKRILKREEYSISQIAYLLGYETAGAFIKSFKKQFGISPGLLRKTND